MNESPKRVWLTIRLRTLLLVLLAFCFAFGWLGAQKRKSARQKALADELTRFGASLNSDLCDFWGRPIAEPPPAWQRWLFGEHYFQRITSATIQDPGMMPDHGRRLGELRDLKVVAVRGRTWGFTDQHAAALAPLRNLETLVVPNTRLTDEGLASVTHLPLRIVNVAGAPVTDAGLAHLAKMPTLESLDLSETLITDAGMKQLARFPRLKHLALHRVMVSSEGIRELAKCPTLESLSLAELPLWPEAFAALGQSPRLSHLVFGYSRFFDGESLRSLREDQLIQEQAAAALGPPSVFWAIDRQEEIWKLPYLRWLLEHGADPNDQTQEVLPLRWLVEKNATAAVHALLEYGARPSLPDRDGRTALSIAAESGQRDMVLLLLTGEDESKIDGEALWLAITRGHAQIVQELIVHGADVKQGNEIGFTPLHVAAGSGRADLVTLLLKHGADPTAKTKSGETPAMIAERSLASRPGGAAEILKLLHAPISPASVASPNPQSGAIPRTVVRKTPKGAPLPSGATLEQAYGRLKNGAVHEPYLRALRDRFPDIVVTPPEASARWATVTLNKVGARMDAVRFTSPIDQAADMRWCFICPSEGVEQWCIMPMKGTIPGFELFWPEPSVDTENLDEPADNDTMYQSLEGGQILPGEEYLVWFTFPDAQPVEMRMAIKLIPVAGTPQIAYGAEAIARDLGLRVPLLRHSPDSPDALVDRAFRVSEFDVRTAAELVENGLKAAPDHRRLLMAASLFNRDHADKVSAVDREAAALIYRRAAEQARAVARRHKDLTFNERLILVHALLAEARVHAQRQDAPQTIAVLSEGFDAGFTRIADLKANDDFAFLQGNSEYVALVDRWRKLMAPPREISYEQHPHPADAIEFNGHWYKLYPGMLPWHLAQLKCQEQGGYLACVESEEEAGFLHKAWSARGFWLGGASEDGDQWRWINGDPLSYAPWADGEPAASDGSQRLMVGPNDRWSAVAPVNPSIVAYLCEWDQ